MSTDVSEKLTGFDIQGRRIIIQPQYQKEAHGKQSRPLVNKENRWRPENSYERTNGNVTILHDSLREIQRYEYCNTASYFE
jgi:hypothetical protein